MTEHENALFVAKLSLKSDDRCETGRVDERKVGEVEAAGVAAEHATVALAALAVHLYDQNQVFFGDSAHFVELVGSLLGIVAFLQSRKSTDRILAAVEHLDAAQQARDRQSEPTPAPLDTLDQDD